MSRKLVLFLRILGFAVLTGCSYCLVSCLDSLSGIVDCLCGCPVLVRICKPSVRMSWQTVTFRKGADGESKISNFGSLEYLGYEILVFLRFLEKVSGNPEGF